MVGGNIFCAQAVNVFFECYINVSTLSCITNVLQHNYQRIKALGWWKHFLCTSSKCFFKCYINVSTLSCITNVLQQFTFVFSIINLLPVRWFKHYAVFLTVSRNICKARFLLLWEMSRQITAHTSYKLKSLVPFSFLLDAAVSWTELSHLVILVLVTSQVPVDIPIKRYSR